MASKRALVFGHFHVHRLHKFLVVHPGRDFVNNVFDLCDDLVLKWHGIGRRTVVKTRQYGVGVVESFAPDIVILELETNEKTGSATEDLARLVLYESYNVKRHNYLSVKQYTTKTRPC